MAASIAIGGGSPPCRPLIWIAFAAALAAAAPAQAAPLGGLPDQRAYELVTPPDTGSAVPTAFALGGLDGIDCFPSPLTTANGDGLAFATNEGDLPGLAGNGALDLFEAERTAAGWQTSSRSASGTESESPQGGLCVSADHRYSTLYTGALPRDRGTLPFEGQSTSYVRAPDGEYAMVGAGPAGVDPHADVRRAAAGTGDLVFTSTRRLTPGAPAAVGTERSWSYFNQPVAGVYRKTSEGVALASLLPDGTAPNPRTETTFYQGSSASGADVVFETVKNSGEATLYLGRSHEPTIEIATAEASGLVKYGGISADGGKVAYVETADASASGVWGTIRVFDAATARTMRVAPLGEAAIVNFSSDGSTVYFVSRTVIPGAANPRGAEPVEGGFNLYRWSERGESTTFIGDVAKEDVEPSDLNAAAKQFSLAYWIVDAVFPLPNSVIGPADDPSRTTPDGRALVFESRADLTGRDPAGHIEIYRFDAPDGSLDCVSCPSDGSPASADARLEDDGASFTPLNALAIVPNLSADGSRVFFEAAARLTPSDVDDVTDVYEWEGGRLFLISGGRGEFPSALYAISPSGDDVFFTTMDRLVPQDPSSARSIYDARVGGGFPPPSAPSPCDLTLDDCQPPAPGAPLEPIGGSEALAGPGDLSPAAQRRHHHRRRRRRKRGRHRHPRERTGARR